MLFKRNVRDAVQLRALCLALQQLAKDAGHDQPLFIGIDQENGLVTRISPPVAPQLPGPMALAAACSLAAARAVAEATGSMLRHFGINMNYAPVADINSEPLNPVIGVRSPGDDPARVSHFADACAAGLRHRRVVPCIKHFPGHGDTRVDSHHDLPVIRKSRQSLDANELVPFRHAAAQAIEMVMTAHISLPALGGGSDLPATLSPEAIGILRNDLGFQGVIMTDCMEMDGVRATYGTARGSLMALQAGVDNVMICHTYQAQTDAIDRVCQALEDQDLSSQQIEASLRRLGELKSRFTSWDDALRPRPPPRPWRQSTGAAKGWRDRSTATRRPLCGRRPGCCLFRARPRRSSSLRGPTCPWAVPSPAETLRRRPACRGYPTRSETSCARTTRR